MEAPLESEAEKVEDSTSFSDTSVFSAVDPR
jgi:hypothetical protein